ncbi:hypothetical protein CDD82_7805 [Ophiocordyceps australis]|uniref:Mannosyl-oligosaccharide glucosidase n=1 Tax=Ophiocordyceps australis TaxID=1399860 RepID=A0A2C5YQR7_9HYPO|nr:hypothetical protein CDD82_7805 [Ophiocordyceps australis]
MRMAALARLVATGLAAALLAQAASASADDALMAGELSRLNNQSLFWGPYKPNLYFGVRPRTSPGLWTGLMWGRIQTYEDVKDGFRYTCEQGPDMHGYGWDEYDARSGGVQTIHDVGNKIDLSTTFVKVPGGGHGGSWAARIKGQLRDDAPPDLKTAVYYYIAQEGDEELRVEPDESHPESQQGFQGDLTLRGRSKALGEYSLVVTKGHGRHPTTNHELSEERPGHTTLVNSQDLAENLLWQARPLIFQQIQKAAVHVQEKYGMENPPPPWQVYRIGHSPGKGNVHIVQKTFEGSFDFDVLFSSASAGEQLDSAQVEREAESVSAAFAQRFQRIFGAKAPFDSAKYTAFAKSMFSNLLGGVGYFYGEQLVDRSYAPEYDEDEENFWLEAAEARAATTPKLQGPYELFTSIPSRPFFPRGFLWDEGFQLAVIADWDMDLALDIVKSWYHTMDDDGWIPREQILGAEARSKVPTEFQVQYPHYANPPTLFLVVDKFVDALLASNGSGPAQRERLVSEDALYTAHVDNAQLGQEYLRHLYPLLQRHYDWFRRTQRGQVTAYDRQAFSTKEAYRWRGRTETHCLTSGLDDYPRPQPPHPGELHADLLSWMGLMTKSLAKIAGSLGLADDVADLDRKLQAIERNLVDLHWSDDEGCFCDATVDEFEENRLVCHKGYVSIMPFLVGLMKPSDARLGRILELIRDESLLWSPHGLRSLSRQDELYGTEENYWRGPVWMPINYLAVVQLGKLASQAGPWRVPARSMYSQLRRNLVETVYKSWEETGFAWEQYNPETGAGQRTQHFTGWTSLVVQLMAMDDIGDDTGDGIGDDIVDEWQHAKEEL